jgi:hypothetical protein
MIGDALYPANGFSMGMFQIVAQGAKKCDNDHGSAKKVYTSVRIVLRGANG